MSVSVSPLISDFAALNVHAETLGTSTPTLTPSSPDPDPDATPTPRYPPTMTTPTLRCAALPIPTSALPMPMPAPAPKLPTPPPPTTTRSLTDTDYFARRQLRQLCTQPHPSEDFLPQASEILPGLYLSDMYTATNPAVLARLGVTHLVSVQRDAPPTPVLRCPPPGTSGAREGCEQGAGGEKREGGAGEGEEGEEEETTQALAHLRVPLDDARGADLQSVLAPAVLWIERARRRGGTVLVHCVWGMSRSPALVIAFLMAAHRMPLGRAWAHVRARRAVARPNAGFVRQLAAYGQVLDAGRRLHEANMARMRVLVLERRERMRRGGGMRMSAGAKVLSLS